MDVNNLEKVLQNSILLGMLQYKALLEPKTDRIKLARAKEYVRSLGLPCNFITICEERGILHRHKSGKARNCAVWYSLKELQQCVVESHVLELLTP